MSQLGSVFDGLEGDADAPRGRDLKAAVRLPRALLGTGPVALPLPPQLEAADGGTAPRTPGPGEPRDRVTLNLPRGTPDGATLRLRGQGEGLAEGRAGDLLLKVWLVGPAAPPPVSQGATQGATQGDAPTPTAAGASPAFNSLEPSTSGATWRPLLGLLTGAAVVVLLGWLITR